jgi:hypothetical protein
MGFLNDIYLYSTTKNVCVPFHLIFLFINIALQMYNVVLTHISFFNRNIRISLYG